MSHHGDSWRWRPGAHRVPGTPTISVIEPASARAPAGRRVPFGFGLRDPERPKHSEADCELHPGDVAWAGW